MFGGENRKFMIIVFLSFFFVLLGMAITTLALSVKAINDNADTSIEQYRQLVRENIEGELNDFARLLRNPNIKEMLSRGTGGDEQRLAVATYTMLEIALGEPFYLVLESHGEVVESKLPAEIGGEVPGDVSVLGSSMLDEFRGKSGELVMVGAALSDELNAAVVVDISDEVEEARQPFEDQRSRVVWLSVFLFLGFLVLATLVVFFVIAWANSRYISGPIKELRDRAERLMQDDTSIEINVDKKSDYYALQALLDSMKRMLVEMEHRSEQ